MIDKSNEDNGNKHKNDQGSSELEHNEWREPGQSPKVNFSYDLDLNKDVSLSPDQNEGVEDDLGFSDDELLLNDELDFGSEHDLEDELYNNHQEDDFTQGFGQQQGKLKLNDQTTGQQTASSAVVKHSGFMDFLKSYGIFLLIAGGLVYYGLQSSLTIILGGDVPQAQTSQDTQQAVTSPTSEAVSISDAPQAENNQSNQDNLANKDKDATSFNNFFGKEKGSNESNNQAVQPVAPNNLTQPDIAPPAITPPTAPGQANQNSLSMPPMPAMPSVANAELDKKIEDLTGQVTQLNQKISKQAQVNPDEFDSFKQQLRTINAQLKQLVTYVQGVSKAMSVINTQIRKQQAVLETIVDTNIGKPASKQKGEQGLTIEAIIAGRAWISTADGKQMTVEKGDRIPGYGRVVKIDSNNGTVTTDIGTVLTQ